MSMTNAIGFLRPARDAGLTAERQARDRGFENLANEHAQCAKDLELAIKVLEAVDAAIQRAKMPQPSFAATFEGIFREVFGDKQQAATATPPATTSAPIDAGDMAIARYMARLLDRVEALRHAFDRARMIAPEPGATLQKDAAAGWIEALNRRDFSDAAAIPPAHLEAVRSLTFHLLATGAPWSEAQTQLRALIEGLPASPPAPA